uniref:Lef-1 protein n=1 Tax=Autographa californica nuclear polyhedrosis virus TaxID=46015 RepID=Q65344_NPVAC|nr:6.0 kDa ORF [Autographa californica nucleopolyhedrovirus]
MRNVQTYGLSHTMRKTARLNVITVQLCRFLESLVPMHANILSGRDFKLVGEF